MAVKVSQATIDKIKKMGMTKALAGAKSANPEMREALTRMYGAKRVSAAGGSTATKYKSADSARSAAAPARYKSADSARSGMSSTASKPTTKTVTGKTASSAQQAVATSRAGGNYKYTAPSWTSTTKTSTPKPKPVGPTAQQIAQGKARAGGMYNTPKPKPRVPETAAQKAAKEALKKKQRAAAAAAVKRAGRSM